MNETLVERIKERGLAHPVWDYQRMTAWLRVREGYTANHKRIYCLMKENGLQVEKTHYRALRKFQRAKPKARRPDEYWGSDMTKFLICAVGWCYLIVVLDWFTKEIMGWNLALRAKTARGEKALDLNFGEHFPWGARDQGLNIVSDNGSQPTSVSLMTHMAFLGINQVFFFYDNPKGNAETERVMRTIKQELLLLNEFTKPEQARQAIEAWINNDYNRLYVHSALGYRSL